jgi:flagellar hook assembly protein FlgD
MPRRKADAAAVVFALLVVATLAAFAYSQRVKRDPLIIDHFTRKGECHKSLKLKFRTTTTNDHATVEIIRPGGEVVKVLAAKQYLKRYHYHTYHWDRTNEAGVEQPLGRYRMKVLLEDEGRELTLPGTIHLFKVKQGKC